MTRNDKLNELLAKKLFTIETLHLIGEDYQISGVLYEYGDKNVTIYNKHLGLVKIHFDNITTLI